MPRAAAEIEAAVRETGLLASGRQVLVMYSGGRDSTCLLHLAVAICGPASVRALHVNYGLRAGAALDERHCAETCERLGVTLTVSRPAGPQRRGNLQDWARRERYAAARLAAGTDDVASGHTADDQLETILYRLISSPSRRALLGMAPRRGQLIRPLLSLTREETTDYCDERGLTYRDDATNDSDVYVRNRIRRELIPLLGELHPGAEANILALAEVLREEQEVLNELADQVILTDASISLAVLAELPRAVARVAVQRLADEVTGTPAAGVGRRIDDILAMADDARLDLPGRVRAVTVGGGLSFERTPPLSR